MKMETRIEPRRPLLETYLSPVVRFGMVVAAIGPDAERIRLSYDDADSIIEYIVLNGVNLSEKLVDGVIERLDDSAQVERVDPSLMESLKLEIPSEPACAGLVTGANLPEFLLNIDGKLALVRTSFTICVDDDQFGLTTSEPLKMHSKIWVRFVLVAEEGGPLRKSWPQKQAEVFYESALAVRTAFESEMLHTYQDFIRQCTNTNLEIASAHRIALATFGGSRAAFNDIVDDLPKRELLSFRSAPHWPQRGTFEEGTSLPSLLAFAGLFMNVDMPGDANSLTEVVDKLSGPVPETWPKFKIVSVDDNSGIRGIFLAEISEKSSTFVGLAADQEIAFRGPEEEPGIAADEEILVDDRIRVARVPANQVTAILSVDIATGL
jgi:hypothetical protein